MTATRTPADGPPHEERDHRAHDGTDDAGGLERAVVEVLAEQRPAQETTDEAADDAEQQRLADLLREYRGDAHTAAWTAAGFDACEIGLVTELYWGLPMRTYARTRAWSEADFDAAEARLTARGLDRKSVV